MRFALLSVLTVLAAAAPTTPKVDLDALAERAISAFKKPLTNNCHNFNFQNIAPRYICNVGEVNQPGTEMVSLLEAKELFTSLQSKLKANKLSETFVATSLYAKPLDARVHGLEQGAYIYTFGYGQGCDWRTFVPEKEAALRKSLGTFAAVKKNKNAYDELQVYQRLAYSQKCVWFGVMSNETPGMVSDTAQLSTEF
jgi:hypothetical protein